MLTVVGGTFRRRGRRCRLIPFRNEVPDRLAADGKDLMRDVLAGDLAKLSSGVDFVRCARAAVCGSGAKRIMTDVPSNRRLIRKINFLTSLRLHPLLA